MKEYADRRERGDGSGRQLVLRLFVHVLRSLGWPYFLSVIGAGALALVALMPAQLMHVFTAGLATTRADGFLFQLSLGGAAVAVGMALAAFGRAVLKERARFGLEIRLRQMIIARFHALPFAALESSQRGEWLTRITRDVRGTEELLGGTLSDIIHHAAIVLGATALLFVLSGPYALIPVGAALLVAVVSRATSRKLELPLARMRVLHGRTFQILVENLEGWKTIRCFAAERHERRRLARELRSFRRDGRNVSRLVASAMAGNDLVAHASVAVCLVALAVSVASGQLNANQALLYPFYLGQFLFSMRALVMGLNAFTRYLPDGERLARLIIAGAEEDPRGQVTSVSPFHRSLERFKLEVDGLPLSRSGAASLIDDLKLRVEQGRLIGIFGPSGCGKSTLLETLAGLRSAERGEVRVWASLREEKQLVWSSNPTGAFLVPLAFCAYVEQRPYVFEGTVRENLTLGARGIRDEQVRAAIEQVGLAEELSRRGGIDLILADRGLNVSAGQLQRIAIARALLRRRPFLLLDEPFSALDPESAACLAATLESLRGAVGIAIVTHFVPPSLHLDERYLFPGAVVPRTSFSYSIPAGHEATADNCRPRTGVPAEIAATLFT